MTTEEARIEVDGLITALGKLQEDSKNNESLKINLHKERELTSKLKEEIKELKGKERAYNRTAFHLRLLSASSDVAICGTCDGAGGFTWDGGPGEGGSEMCAHCEGTGIIEKQSNNQSHEQF